MSLLASFLPTVIKAVLANPLKSDGNTKGLLASKTMQGAASLAIIPTMIFPLVDDLGAGKTVTAAIKLVLMCTGAAWTIYGRATATTGLGKS